MPMTPQEQQELQELQELEELEASIGHTVPQGPAADPRMKAMSAMDAFNNGGMKALSLGYFDPSKSNEQIDQSVKAHPNYDTAGQVAGSLAPGMAAAKGVKALTKGAGALKTIGAEMAAGGLQGAVQKPGADDSRPGNAMLGGAMGVAGGAINAGGKMLADGGKLIARKAARFTPGQADAYVSDPKGVASMAGMLDDPRQADVLQDQARSAFQNSRQALGKNVDADRQTLEKLLTGNQVEFNPEQYRGVSPQVDDYISNYFKEQGHLAAPRVGKMDAYKFSENVKGGLQDAADYVDSPLLDPTVRARYEAAGEAANRAKQAVEGVNPEAGVINGRMREALKLRTDLGKKANGNALQAISTEAPDRLAPLARAERKGAGGLLDFGEKLGAAKSMQTKDVDDAMTRFGIKTAGRLGLRAIDGLEQSTPAVPTQQLIGILEGLKNRK